MKDASAKPSAEGGVFKAKISGTSNLRATRLGRGELSSNKYYAPERIKYRVTPPTNTNLEPKADGSIRRIYLEPDGEYNRKPKAGDVITWEVVSGDSTGTTTKAYAYEIDEYKDVDYINGKRIRWVDLQFVSGTQTVVSGGDTSVSKIPEISSLLEICGLQFNDDFVCTVNITYSLQGNPKIVVVKTVNSTLSGVGSVGGKLSGRITLGGNGNDISAEGAISAKSTADYVLDESVDGSANLSPTFLDKFAGTFAEYKCVEKLYPSGDLEIDAGMLGFVDRNIESGNLYSSIDEGVILGDDYHKHGGQGSVISDDAESWITPNSFHTEGVFQYKAELTNLHIRPDNTHFRIRASAPLSNYESKIPPLYEIKNVKFLDPSGNLMVQYEDITLLGDVDYSNENTFGNFATYSLSPTFNIFDQYDWQRRSQPHTHNISGYQISFDVKATPRDDAFDTGFDHGFEEDYVMHTTYATEDDYLALDGAPLATQDQSLINPTKALRISAVEICNSGGVWLSERTGPRREDYFNLFLDVPSKGRRLEKKILPSFFSLADANNSGVWPAVSSVWNHKNQPTDLVLGNNLDICGSEQIVKALQIDSELDYAELHTTGPHYDSGKMIMKFGYGRGEVNEIVKGAFNCAFDQNNCPIWFNPSGAFNTETKSPAGFDDNYLEIESITLKIKAKKAAGTRDFVLDVVGWSDDKLLNVTKAPSGFLQNPNSVQINNNIISSDGTHPVISGFDASDDDLALSTRSISEREKYLESSGNLGGDHYSLTNYPIVNTTEFADYEVPLKIYPDDVEVGLSRNYNVSSMLEHLFLDIYPLPSGAAIASAHLLVRYAPQAALKLSVQGGECLGKIQDGRSEGKIFPTTKQSNDSIINAGSGYSPLSTIQNIPHAYTTPSSIKSNYSRRWRGLEGTVQGPFDTDQFSFGFNNPLLEFPFLSGFYNFDYVEGKYVKSRTLGDGYGGVSGLFNVTPERYKNVGWRFKTQNIFDSNAPSHTSSYRTSDWTALTSSSLSHDFSDHELYGRIADAFDNIVRISGHNKNINFGNVDASGGFSVFARFTPDVDVSGTSYDLFQSGVLFSKWSSPSDMDFALGYDDGYLCGYAKATDGTVVSVKDTVKYSGYQFPLSVILTYNDHESEKLKLYTDNELHSGVWNTLRASSSEFTKHANNADLIVGHSDGSGVGMNMLLSEFGISTYTSGVYGSGTNIVQTNADATYKQVTAQKFLENHRVKFFEPGEPSDNDTYKLWDYVNEDTYADWNLGGFQHCEFGIGFASLSSRPGKRTGKDLISFHLKSSGVPYQNQDDIDLTSWPSTVSSGVSYHTQIENDFLRFHLSDTTDNFHSVAKRITKDLPHGYVFADEALVVDTIIEHRSSGTIEWPECQPTTFHLCSEHKHSHQDHFSGPRLVVSLYTKKKEPYWTPNESNWGLINRAIHYVDPSSCMMKLSSKFDYQNLTDDSEQWALFPQEPRLTEFTEKYYSQDVDDMFLQYDLVYPSGGPFDSNIDVHSAHVRMDDAFVTCVSDSGNFNLFASGCTDTVTASINLHALSEPPEDSGVLNLNTFGPVLIHESGFQLNTSGNFRSESTMSLHAIAIGVADSSWNPPGMSLLTKGCCDVVVDGSGSFNLITNGNGTSAVEVPLTVVNDGLVDTPSGQLLPLNVFAHSGVDGGMFTSLRLRMHNELSGGSVSADPAELPVYILGSAPLVDISPEAKIPLFIMNDQFTTSGTLNLTVYGDDSKTSIANSESTTGEGDSSVTKLGMNLYIPNYGGVGSVYLRWYNKNYGVGIDQRDNAFAAIDVGNEIRGVDLIGYGSCDSDSPRKAIDKALVTDETIWRPETCNDGGIFRAVETYTNSGAINFEGGYGYSGNYYGFRKYTGLVPNSAYQSTLKITTGSTESIKVPRDFEEWEYGTCGPNWRGGDQGDGDCDTDIVYSGAKLIGDYPYMSGDASITPDSGRNEFDNYGERVAVTDDLMVISSPKIEVEDASGYAIPDAGSLFLYRRDEDVAGEKAAWKMEDKLMLPSGFRRDYVSEVVQNVLRFDQFSISGQKWDIGQEGRKLGSSLDVGVSGERETIVAGAPFAGWSRQFPEIVSSGIKVGAIVLVDKFDYNDGKIKGIGNAGRRWEHLYKYFSAPWNAKTPQEFQARLDVKTIVLQLSYHDDNKPAMPEKYKHFFRHHYIPRVDDTDLVKSLEAQGSGVRDVYNLMYSGIVDAFKDMFPTPASYQPHSGVPPILGIFKDESHSTGFGDAFQMPDTNEDVMNDFVDFYEEYAFASGAVNPEVPTAISGHVKIETGVAEKWELVTKNLINNTLDSGYLINTNLKNTGFPVLSVVTSGVGQKWAKSNANEFQIPPASGGRVFIFERESGKFNCVQEIIPYSERDIQTSDDNTGDYDDYLGGLEYNDRFGHSVGISKDTSIVSIGSPFTDVPCEVFERQDAENTRMYNNISGWLDYRNLDIPLNRYIELVDQSGTDVAQKQTYHELSHTNKFWLRTDKNFWLSESQEPIQLYKPIYNYKYSDISSTGTWGFIANTFAGTSRLGYSTSVSDNGDVVAFGAPTDSTNMFEDTNVWYTKSSSERFASFTNAGAVRMFESKVYVPHSGAVEFTRFGNLDRSVHPELREEGYYDRMPNYFAPDKIPFRRMGFSEIEIPRDVGLAFIITPELDATSDEVIDNIKNWLALGDRTLVLVGNDPLWEEDGLYRESNDIVNKILEKLDSRMRVVAADTKYESLNGAGNRFQDADGCVNDENTVDDRFNITKSFVPEKAHTETFESTIQAPNMFAKGVGKIVIDLSDIGLEDLAISSPCDKLNSDVCNMPIKHLGDLRAQWKSECATQNSKLKYKTNWPFHFANPNNAQACRDYPESPKPYINRPYEDIVPILTAAEWLPDQYWFIPEETFCETGCDPIWEYYFEEKNITTCEFAEDHLLDIKLSASGDGIDNVLGIFDEFDVTENKGGFIDPQPENGRDAIIKGVGTVREDVKITYKYPVISTESVLAVEESYIYQDSEGNDVDGNNRVFIIASTNGENNLSFADGGGTEDSGGNSDQNIVFYTNIAKKDCSSPGHLVQLGGWTKRSSFADAYGDSILGSKLEAFGFEVTENGVYPVGTDIDAVKTTDTVWIANPDGVPSDDDISVLSNWLKNNDKKLVITYSAWDSNKRQKYANNVSVICEKLGLSSRPFSRPCEGDYAVCPGDSSVEVSNKEECCPYDSQTVPEPTQKIAEDSDIFAGCDTGYGWKNNYNSKERTSAQKVSLRWDGSNTESSDFGQTEFDFIPISGGGDFTKLIWYNSPIRDKCPVVSNNHTWYINGEAEGQFDVEAGSGYRIFVSWVSETKNEKYPIDAYVEEVYDADCTPVEDLTDGWRRYFNNDQDSTQPDQGIGLVQTDVATPESAYLDVRANKTGKMKIGFDTNRISLNGGGISNPKHDPEEFGLPQTVRVIGVSGFPLPIETKVTTKRTRKRRQIGEDCWEKCTTIPASSGVIPGEFRPIKHLSEEYCNPDAPPCPDEKCCPPRGEEEIQDGPVVAAEEFEHFTAGKNGFRRSKIVLLSDSTMIQGQCPHYRNDSVGENQAFIRSLYPVSPEKRSNRDLGFDFDVASSNRQFQFTQKLRAPERGSAGKYYAAKLVNNTVPPLYGGGATADVSKYYDDEDTFHPADVYRPKNPPTADQIAAEVKYFTQSVYPNLAYFPRFSGDFLGRGSYTVDGVDKDFLIDADRRGGINELMKVDHGRDYLDFDYYTSGCAGDLFGFSLDLSNDKLIVGTPFNGFITENVASGTSGIVQWHEIKNDPFRSGISVSQNGGAGAAFYFERTNSGENVVSEKLPWEFIQKIKPSSINIGIDNCTVSHLQNVYGNHDLNADFVSSHAGRGDQFGYSVAIDADMVAIGAPNHDFETLHDHIYSGAVVTNDLNTAFQRKSFNPEFDIPLHQYFDLGDSGNRTRFSGSGTVVLNRGAVFNYRHSFVNWQTREKAWIYGEKLVAHGHHTGSGSRFVGSNLAASGNDNDKFGRSVSLFRSERGDSDYTLAVGAPFHGHPTSGNHISSGVTEAGAAFTYDAMLREQQPTIPNSGSWIDVKIFGAKTEDGQNMLLNRVYQNTTGKPQTYYTSGIVFSNPYGDIYIEASGFDPSVKGFVAHRPFVESVIGDYAGGDPTFASMSLIASGGAAANSGVMNLMLSGAASADVYNNMNLRTVGASGTPSGDFPMFISAPSGASSGILNLNVASTQTTENLNLRVRGK